MIEGINAMKRLNDMITNKNSRICAELNIDNVTNAFKEKFFSENLCDEIVYEYAVTYLGTIADIVPAVKLTAKERDKLYWHIAEVAKELGFFVICEVEQEELSYIIENKMKLIAKNSVIDAVIIDVDLSSKLEIVEQFLELLKESKKAAFIKARRPEDDNKKTKWWRIFKKKKQITTRDLFLKLFNKVERICYDENSMLTYVMIGVAIMEVQDYEMLNPYIFSLICNYEQQEINEMVSIVDGEGQGGLILIDLANVCLKDSIYSEEDWLEIVRKETVQKNIEINNAINTLYGIENF